MATPTIPTNCCRPFSRMGMSTRKKVDGAATQLFLVDSGTPAFLKPSSHPLLLPLLLLLSNFLLLPLLPHFFFACFGSPPVPR